VAEDAQGICGTVQLVFDLPGNQAHRAGPAKKQVHRPGPRVTNRRGTSPGPREISRART